MPTWSPETWDDFGVVGIVVFLGGLFYVSVIREWIVPGRYHRRLEARAEKDAETIETLSQALTENNAQHDTTTRLLESLRDSIRGGGR